MIAAAWIVLSIGLLSLGSGSVGRLIVDVARGSAETAPWSRDGTYVLALIMLLIVGWNVFGMIPGVYTVTSQLIVTISLAVVAFGGAMALRSLRYGGYFLSIFTMPGFGLVLLWMLTLIETVSFVARGGALAIRLFCNLMSGHVLLKCLLGSLSIGTLLASPSALLLATSLQLLMFVSLVAIIVGVCILELLVAILQGYVFLVLVLGMAC